VIGLVRAEFLKIRTTQVWFWLLLAALAVSALIVIATMASAQGVISAADVPDVFATTNSASIVVFVLGILGVTTEFRYQTITPTVLATPSRWTLISAKMITYVILGALYALACLVVELAIAVPWLAAKNVPFNLGDPDLRRALLGLVLVLALLSIVGLGVGALIRNQIVAVTVGLVFLLLIQNIIVTIPYVRAAWPYTPSGAVTAILFHRSGAPDDVSLLSPLAGVLVLLLWAFVPAVIGASYSMNRDIT
jgi:hypothetical protein